MIRLTPLAPAARSVLQITMIMSALVPFEMKVLLPLMTHSSPSRTAVVRQAFTSEPPPGSVIATARMVLPAQMSGQPALLLRLCAQPRDVGRHDVRVQGKPRARDPGAVRFL